MKQLSVEASFLWVQRFVAREWRLLLPLVIAFLALPQLLLDLFQPKSMMVMMGSPDMTVPPDFAGLLRLFPFALVVTLIGIGGSLSIVSLAMVPRISVREAIVHGFRRLPALIAVGLLVFALLLMLAILVAILLTVGKLPFLTQQALLMGLLFGVGVVIWVRLVMLAPLIVDRRIGPVSAARLAWEHSQGHFWRLFGAMFLYGVGAAIVIVAVSSSVGAILVLLGRAIGLPDLGALLSIILFRVLVALGSAGLQLLAVAFYRQLGARSGT